MFQANALFQEDFKEIAFYEFAAAPVYPEFEFQLVSHHHENLYIYRYIIYDHSLSAFHSVNLVLYWGYQGTQGFSKGGISFGGLRGCRGLGRSQECPKVKKPEH